MSEERNWNVERESVETRRDYVSVRVQILASVFNRKISDELIRVFKDALERFPTKVMSEAFRKAEQQLERFPSPKLMQTICGECLPPQTWRYNFVPAKGRDPENKTEVNILIDPDPSCARCREPRSEHPIRKTAHGILLFTCQEYRASGLGNDEEMFLPQHCPGGRAFLSKLRELAGRQKPEGSVRSSDS